MDTDTLVENQVENGHKLLVDLLNNHFDVMAACWARTSEEGRWFLFIVSKDVDEKGSSVAYREAYGVLQAMENPWLSVFEVKLVSPNTLMAKAILEMQPFCTGHTATQVRTPRLGNVGVEEVYVYPPPDRLLARPRI